MFKSPRKLVRKCGESCRFTDRGSGKPKKNVGNSNITSKRLTIPPGFLCLGNKSKTIRKSSEKEKSKNQRDCILREDLHGLFDNNLNETITKPRRSSRILKKVEQAQNLNNLSASDYYSEILTQDNNSGTSKESEGCFQENKPTSITDNSKSLFRKINKRYAKAAVQNTINFNYIVKPILEENVKVEVFKEGVFCKSLSKEICTDLLEQIDSVLDCKEAISKKTQEINDILCGNIPAEEEMSDNKNGKSELGNDREEERKYFDYIPRCDWIYDTPPRQRIALPKVDECAIQPAVICTTKKQSNIYELNSNINVNLTNYSNRQNIDLDRRYLKHLASFEDKMHVDFGMESTGGQERGVNEGGDNYNYFPNQHLQSNVKFTFDNPFLNAPENHFMPIISRPMKTVKRQSRVSSILKRKLEEFDSTPTCSSSTQPNDQFEADFTFIDDNGQFKMVSTQSTVEDNGCNFKFPKNVFKVCEEENIFNFKKDEPKMFDFSLSQKKE